LLDQDGGTVLSSRLFTRRLRWLGCAAAATAVVLGASSMTANAGEVASRPPVCEDLRGAITGITPLAPGRVEVTGWTQPGWSDTPRCNTTAHLFAYTGWSVEEGWYKDAIKGFAPVHPRVDEGGQFTEQLTIEWGNYAVCLEDTTGAPIECFQVLVPGQRGEDGVYQPTMPIVRGWIPNWLGAKNPDVIDGGPLPECGHCI
jgi:hypothetical protein